MMELMEKLRLLKNACEMCEKIDYVKAIESYLSSMNDPIKIMIVGEGKHGKSTLLNGLLGRKVANEGYGSKTANLNYYKKILGKERVSTTSFYGPFIEIKNDDELEKYYEKFQEEKDTNAYWLLKLKWPANDIIVVDTEGFNQVNRHLVQEEAHIRLENGLSVKNCDLFDKIYFEADIIIWCVRFQAALGRTIEKYESVRVYNKPIFLVYTCADEYLADDAICEEMLTVDDYKNEMREDLGLIAKECVKDFAGFAGDKINIERREHFLFELRECIDKYIISCENGVKVDAGERLYRGIYQQMFQNLCDRTEDEVALFKKFYDGLEKIEIRTNDLKENYIGRISNVLDEINSSIKHYELYENCRKECNGNMDEAFAMIKKIYEDIFAEQTLLHQLIDVELPERIKLMKNEFLFFSNHITDNSEKDINFPELWKVQKDELMNLRIKAENFWGTKWKAEEFKKYFKTIKSTWEQMIMAELTEIKARYNRGFIAYLKFEHQEEIKSFIRKLIVRDATGQVLKSIEGQDDISKKEYYLYNFSSPSVVVGIYGEHNIIYQRMLEYFDIPQRIEDTLINMCIDKDFTEYEYQIKQFFEEFDFNDIESAIQVLKVHKISDIINISEDYEGLSRIKAAGLNLKKAQNLNKNNIQSYYLERIELLKNYYKIQKDKSMSVAKTILQGEAKKWISTKICVPLEQKFELWKMEFWEYFAERKKRNEFSTYWYYGFRECLERTESFWREIYAKNRDKVWKEGVQEVLFAEESVSHLKKVYIMHELSKYLSDFEKKVTEEERKQKQIYEEESNHALMGKIDLYLKKSKCIATKISCLQLIEIDHYDYSDTIKRKIASVDCEINKDEKDYLTNSYEAVEKLLFNEICELQIYKDMRRELRKYYTKQMENILLGMKNSVQGGIK